MDQGRVPQEILSPFSTANRDADARAFAALMKHLREIDGTRHTVVMVQVENEIGMIPSARDHSPEADARVRLRRARRADERPCRARRSSSRPSCARLWQAAGGRRAGTWTEVFGDGPAGQEVFMAWHFARYTEADRRGGEEGVPAADVRERGAHPARAPAGPVPERGAAART